MSIHLYAELLLNIKTISLHGSVTSLPSGTQPQRADADDVILETNGPVLTVSHRGQTSTLRLPVQNIGTAKTKVQLPLASEMADFKEAKDGSPATESDSRARQITARISLSGDDVASYLTLSASDESVSAESVPWAAPQLSSATGITCRECGELAIADVGEWRDLPREGWADLMDVWYCHKPVDHTHTSGDEQTQGKRGYGANNILEVRQGLGFVDSGAFLVHAKDAKAKISSESILSSRPMSAQLRPSDLLCTHCDAAIGMLDIETDGYRLLKHRVAIKQNIQSSPKSFPLEKWIADRVVSHAEGQATKKFVVNKVERRQQSESHEKWLFWILTTDFYFCSTSVDTMQDHNGDQIEGVARSDAQNPDQHGTPDRDPLQPSEDDMLRHTATRACKVLYKPIASKVETDKADDELELTTDLHPVLWSCLEQNQQLMPQSGRKMGDWDVSLLRRFDLSDIDPEKFSALMREKKEKQQAWDSEMEKRQEERRQMGRERQAADREVDALTRDLYE